MANWYNQVKEAWNAGIATMENPDKIRKNKNYPYIADPMVTYAPPFGGEKRKGYPENTQALDGAEIHKGLLITNPDEWNFDDCN